MSEKELIYKAHLAWTPKGQKFTYKEYSREYIVRIEDKPDFIGTAAPEFLGTEHNYNPEDLLIASLSACHMLTFLAYAAVSKIEVLSYEDKPEGILGQHGKIYKFDKMILKPTVKLASKDFLEKAKPLHEKAHKGCFIANSVNFPVEIEPEFVY